MTILEMADFARIFESPSVASWSMFDWHLTWHLSFLASFHCREGSWGVIESAEHINLTCSSNMTWLNKRSSGNFYINSNHHWHQGIRGVWSQVQRTRYHPRERERCPDPPHPIPPLYIFCNIFVLSFFLFYVHTGTRRHSWLNPYPLSLTQLTTAQKSIITCAYLPIGPGSAPLLECAWS